MSPRREAQSDVSAGVADFRPGGNTWDGNRGRKFWDPSHVLLTLDGRGVSNTNKQLVHTLTQRFLSSGMKNKKKSAPLPIQVLQALFGTKREISIIPVEAFFFFCEHQRSDRKELNASHVWYAFLV